MVVECRRDCEYYSTYTDTCDYTLLTYTSRGCPIDACTRYRPRTRDRRPWSIWNRKQGPNPLREDAYCGIPEPAFDYVASLPNINADTFYELMRTRVDEEVEERL